MIAPPSGTRIWIAAGVTDMRRGFDRLAALVQTQLEADPFWARSLPFADDAVIGSNCCGGTATDCACSANAWNKAVLFGRKRTAAACR